MLDVAKALLATEVLPQRDVSTSNSGDASTHRHVSPDCNLDVAPATTRHSGWLFLCTGGVESGRPGIHALKLKLPRLKTQRMATLRLSRVPVSGEAVKCPAFIQNRKTIGMLTTNEVTLVTTKDATNCRVSNVPRRYCEWGTRDRVFLSARIPDMGF